MIEVTESAAAVVPLSREQANALIAMGRRLTSARVDVEESDRTLIECSTSDGVNWRLRVVNAIGVLGLPGGLQIKVKPKIPLAHLVHLLQLGGALPRTINPAVSLSKADDFHDLICAWFLSSLEALLRGGLRREYVAQEERLPVVRGRIDARRTALDMTRGQVALSCSFEELTEDTPLNRVLLAAARKVARNSLVPGDLRRRGRSAIFSIDAPSPLRPSDIDVQPDRVSARYVDAIALARLVLADTGVALDVGPGRGSSFLLPTPFVVESALRRIVSDALAPTVSVVKGRLPLVGTNMTVNPDLDFGLLAIGDVKYKVWDGSWNRADLYQLIAFAAAYDRKAALHVGFGGSPPLEPLAVGDIRLWRATWNCDDDVDPIDAATAFVEHVRRWWLDLHPSTPHASEESPAALLAAAIPASVIG